MARDLKLDAISIADHDAVKGSQIAAACCQDYGLEVLPNVEITTFFQGRELHILSYFIDLNATEVLKQLAEIRAFDEARIAGIVVRLNELGIDVTYEETKALCPHAAPKSSVLAKAVMTNGRNHRLALLQPYFEGCRSDQPFHNFSRDTMRPGGIAYVEPALRYSTIEAIKLVRDHGGIPILAHPAGSLSCPKEMHIIDTLRTHDLCGLEVYSSYHSEADEILLEQYCAHHGLAVTAGSDFHGPTVKPQIRMGEVRHNPYSLVERLKEKRRIVNPV